MEIYLPNSAFLGNIDPFLRKISLADPDSLLISANKKWISLHPVALCIIGSLGSRASHVSCEKLEAKSKHYLERMGLFKLLKMESRMDIVRHESAGRFIPLTHIADSDALSKFIADIVPLLHLNPEHADPIRYVVSELVRNVFEHSRSDGAIVCAQYYKKSNSIKIGIADHGVGIRHTISQSYPVSSDLEALRLALTPGITGTTHKLGGTEFNAGAGLFFIKSIAQINRDFFMIYSGTAMYKLLKSKRIALHGNPMDDKHSKGEDYPCWNGTVVGIDISLDKTEEFSRLLDMIRETYMKTLRERKKERFRPRFI